MDMGCISKPQQQQQGVGMDKDDDEEDTILNTLSQCPSLPHVCTQGTRRKKEGRESYDVHFLFGIEFVVV